MLLKLLVSIGMYFLSPAILTLALNPVPTNCTAAVQTRHKPYLTFSPISCTLGDGKICPPDSGGAQGSVP